MALRVPEWVLNLEHKDIVGHAAINKPTFFAGMRMSSVLDPFTEDTLFQEFLIADLDNSGR